MREWTCLPRNANSPYEENNNEDPQLNLFIETQEEQLLKEIFCTYLNDEAKIANEEKIQMQANKELAKFLGLATSMVKTKGDTEQNNEE